MVKSTSDMHIAIRPATTEDAPEAVALLRASISELCVEDHRNDPDTLEAWLGNKTAENFSAAIAQAENRIWIAESEGRMAGLALLHIRPLNTFGEIRLLYLLPGLQRSGIGRALHEKMEREAIATGVACLQLHSTLGARRFYEAMGYRSAGPAMPFHGILKGYPYEKTLSSADLP